MPRSSQNNQKDDRKLILDYLIQTSNEIIYWNQMANDKSFEMAKQLIGAGVITIPLIGTFVVTDRPLFNGAGYLIAFSLFNIFASVFFGLKHLDTAAEFFNGYALFNSKRAESLYRSLLENNGLSFSEALKRAAETNSGKTSQNGNNAYIIIQSIFLGIGLFILAGVIVSAVFIN